MTPRLTPERVRELLAAATPGPIDVHRCDADGGAIDYQLQRGAGTGGTVLGYATDHDGSPRAKADALLWSRASDLAADVLALHDALARVTRERDAAVAARDALVTAVRAYLESVDAYDEDDYEDTVGAIDRDRERLDALLAGAPSGYVPARLVRAYLAAREAVPEGFDADYAGADERARVYALWDAVDAARTALDAALAAATTTPKESR